MMLLTPKQIVDLDRVIEELKERDQELSRLKKKIEILQQHNKERLDAYTTARHHLSLAEDFDRRAIQDSQSGEPEVPQYS
jgi:hypothetical protein